MIYRSSKLLKTLIIISLFVCQSYGQNVGTTSLQFLKIVPSAKIMAMGEAGVANTNDAAAVFMNPAGLTGVNKLDVSFNTVDWFLDTRINAISAAYSMGNYGVFGIHVIDMDYGEFEETRVDHLGFVGDTYNPGLTGVTFNPTAFLVGLSYARALTNNFSFGITGNYINEDLFLDQISTFTFNAGMFYDMDFKSLKIGIALRNLGPGVKYVEKKYSLPQTIIVGIKGDLIAPGENIFMKSTDHRVSMAIDLIEPRDYDQEYHIGLEYGIYNTLNLRTGYKINYDNESWTFGAGFIWKSIRLDYAYNDFGDYLEPAHRFSLGLSF